ncbi:hypothetical protein R1sor_005766 [Riccia sorocarpa]|uniref:Uncharacterized protein n=1 Tax=Riccia sorocarpa TaxID=122646 RepID=A0ABD3HKG2_9MARC
MQGLSFGAAATRPFVAARHGVLRTSEGRYVPDLEVIPSVSLPDGSAKASNYHVQELAPFVNFDYPGTGESTPVDPPPTMSHQSASVAKENMHVDYADPETHPPSDVDSDQAPIHGPPYTA